MTLTRWLSEIVFLMNIIQVLENEQDDSKKIRKNKLEIKLNLNWLKKRA